MPIKTGLHLKTNRWIENRAQQQPAWVAAVTLRLNPREAAMTMGETGVHEIQPTMLKNGVLL